ncbi:MAG TPA: DUF4416 family protein [Candidatus Aminicenantes bacterium]|nr:DUF4416 family protein [Candidatus Aminicenantes bacterium]HRY65206.1 DUF4416 family protein [Candidatus Aminicenantes bacterium]HRZ72326.1 DUF4416 family protein [Candidatus Aminicenantes bacterium]
MAKPKEFAPVKLICGVISGDGEGALYAEVRRRLEAEWGRVDGESPAFPFDLTDYYEAEMGPGLVRRFMSFADLVAPGSLPERKVQAIGIEEEMRRAAGAAGRPVNIDPGYLTASALVMATAKDFAHRVPLTQGIYAHLEFLFTRTGVRTLDWTYPDLRRGPAQTFFRAVRDVYLRQAAGR